ncbi:hypothetical protein ACFYO1_11550 [Nocardia sp. NPDC006044]|uniref:hypothetical protein n=1 Tax=Nocardia sp. NPDC006044 TaxID=3364306 RepID=UPI0036BDEB80
MPAPGAIHLYDSYGQNIDPATGMIGDIPIPATAEDGVDFGYLGQHTVPIEHIAGQQALEMGARTCRYSPIAANRPRPRRISKQLRVRNTNI